MFSLIETPYLSEMYNLVLLLTIALVYIGSVRRDLMNCENNSNLSPFKICYLLAKNIEAKHKLNKQNYDRLALLLRIKIIAGLYIFVPIAVLVSIILGMILLFKTTKLVWVLYEIVIIPFYINNAIFILAEGIRIQNVILYYKMRFDQLNKQIKSLIPTSKWKFFILRKEKLLLKLINKHNNLAVEVDKINYMFRISSASQFITFSFAKIVSLYLILNTKNLFIKIFAIDAFVLHSSFGLALSYIYSLQIESAHQCIDSVYLITSKCKMQLKLRLKVKLQNILLI